MRIAMVTPFNVEHDGLADYRASLSGELEALGHDVSIVLPARGAGESADLPHLPAVPTSRAIRSLVASLKRPDLIHVQFAVSAFHTRLPALIRLLEGARVNDVPVIIEFPAFEREFSKSRGVIPASYRRIGRLCTRVFVRSDKVKDAVATELDLATSSIDVVTSPAEVAAAQHLAIHSRFEVDVRRRSSVTAPELSAVVCSYNGGARLARCLRSLDRQAGMEGRLQLVVVDDGSSDNTSEVAERFNATVVRHVHNLGASAARNTGLLFSSAPYVGFLDDDCEPASLWASALLQSWATVEADVQIVGGPLDPVTADTPVGRFTRRHDPLKPLELDLAASTALSYRLKLYLKRLRKRQDARDIRRVFAVASANISMRRDEAIAIGGFDERFRFGGEDTELCRRTADGRALSPILFDPSVRASHHFVGTLRDALRRSSAYGRGAARLNRARSDVPPTIFPAPVAAAGLIAVAPWFPAALLGAAILPPLLYGWRAASGQPEEDDATQWLDAYLTLVQEGAANVGFLRGWRAHSLLAPTIDAPTIAARSGARHG